MSAVTQSQRDEAEKRYASALGKDSALDLIDYLSMRARFRALRELKLDREFELGDKNDHDLLVDVRNEAAHHGLSDADRALEAIAKAESMLGQLAAAFVKSQQDD